MQRIKLYQEGGGTKKKSVKQCIKYYDYVPMTWIYSYVMEKQDRRRGRGFYKELIICFRQFNSKMLSYQFSHYLQLFGDGAGEN